MSNRGLGIIALVLGVGLLLGCQHRHGRHPVPAQGGPVATAAHGGGDLSAAAARDAADIKARAREVEADMATARPAKPVAAEPAMPAATAEAAAPAAESHPSGTAAPVAEAPAAQPSGTAAPVPAAPEAVRATPPLDEAKARQQEELRRIKAALDQIEAAHREHDRRRSR